MKNDIQKKVLIISNNIECERHVQFFGRIEKYFIVNNWELIDNMDDSQEAAMVVICACGYHKMMYDRVIGALANLRQLGFQDNQIIIAGCLPKTYEEQLKSNFSGHLVEFRKPEAFDDVIDPLITFNNIEVSNLFKVWGTKQENRNKMFYIKISDGCLGHCTYCVIKRAKGSLSSLPKEEILKQYLKALNAGYRRIFLMGDDTFAYGLDIGSSIIELLHYLFLHNDNVELYFGSLDIKWLKKYYNEIRQFCKAGKIKKLDFGIQHVCDNVLKRMCREQDFAKGYEMIRNLKNVSPDLFISADIIVGFPGESQKDYEALLEFFRNDRIFNSIKHYGFCEIEGTPASKLPSELKVHPFQIAHRWQLLKDALVERSMYNATSDPDSQGDAFKRTFEENIFLCNDSFIDIK